MVMFCWVKLISICLIALVNVVMGLGVGSMVLVIIGLVLAFEVDTLEGHNNLS